MKKAKKSKPKSQSEVPCVNSVPAQCPRCGCSDRTGKNKMQRRDMRGTTASGKHYTQVVWSYVSCRKCSANYRIIEYLNPTVRPGGPQS